MSIENLKSFDKSHVSKIVKIYNSHINKYK